MPREVFSGTGNTRRLSGYVTSVVWVGTTAQGDTCEVIETGGNTFWKGQTDLTNTYLGITFEGGQKISNGLTVSQISNGKVYIYFKEDQ